MPIPNPTPIERHILDLLDRIAREQADRIAALEMRVRKLETRNATLEAKLDSQAQGVTALADSLASFLDPSGLPPA